MSGSRIRLLAAIIAVICLSAAIAALPLLSNRAPGGAFVPGQTPISHVVVIMKENHAFDNYFGTFPGADGIPANVSLSDGRGGMVSPRWINGSSTHDLPHDRESMILAWNNGSNDGFAAVAETWGEGLGAVAMGFYDDRQLPYYWSLAKAYALGDRYFTSMFGPTVPNRLYSIAGTNSGLTTNSIDLAPIDSLTIFDQLEERGISWRYYYSPFEPYLPLPRYFPHIDADPQMISKIKPLESLVMDLESGDLAQVVYVDSAANLTVSEHAPGDVTVGEGWTESIIAAIMSTPQWKSTAVLLTMDESGGFYDHVPPPQVDEWGYGFRVPLIVVSPYAKRGWIDHTVMDHTSILKFIATNWELPPLTGREAAASDMLHLFDFPDSVTTQADAPWLSPQHAGPAEAIQGVFPEAIPRKSWS